MIVTRQRRNRSLARRLVLPVVALAILAFALAWPPSHRVIAEGPLKLVWGALANAGATVGRPLSFAGTQQRVDEREHTIRALGAELDKQRQARADAESRVQQLQEQVSELSSQPRPAPAPRIRPTPGAAGLVPVSAANVPSGQEKRVAATWSAMDPDKAAAVVQRLPIDEVTRVLAAMDPDSAGAIMDALPAAVAARISRTVAQVATTTDR